MRSKSTLTLGFLLVITMAVSASAEIPPLITVQGRMTDSTSAPIPDGIYDVVVYIATDSLAGDLIWGEKQTASLTGGLFTLQLGSESVLPDSIFTNHRDLFVFFEVDGFPGVTEPRVRLTSGAFAFHALVADTARYVTGIAANGWVDEGTVVHLSDSTDQVVIGSSTPSGRLYVRGTGSPIIRANNTSPSGTATAVYATSASTSGCGVMGSAGAASGATRGVEGYAASPDGYAFYGFNEAESGDAYVFYGENYSPDGIAIYGTANADDAYTTGIGVYGRSRSDYGGTGVYGEVTNTGTTYGVRGVAAHGTGVRGEQTESGNMGSLGRSDEGVYGRGFGGDGDGVHGVAASTDPLAAGAGVYGESVCPASGSGVVGIWDGDTLVGMGYGGYFETSSWYPAVVGFNSSRSGLSIGTYGYASSATGTTYGLYGVTQSPDGIGVLGSCVTSNGTGVGVYGETPSAGGNGIYGTNTAPTTQYGCAIFGERVGKGIGVEGTGGTRGMYGHVEPTGSSSYYGVFGLVEGGSGTNYGVYGDAVGSGTNYGGYFVGDAEVTGTLYKGGGAFKIDHPLDPEGKYLCHSFVESPDMKNIYDGVVTTDARGYATVVLPEWFEALNRDFRYQLTVIDDSDGDDFVQAKVVRKISNNQFTIRTSRPDTEVSWQVTGIRHDAFAEANRVAVEVTKNADETGTYLHPELWGQPIDRRVDRARDAELGASRTGVSPLYQKYEEAKNRHRQIQRGVRR